MRARPPLLPPRRLTHARPAARSGVAAAKALVRLEFERERLAHELARHRRRASAAEADLARATRDAVECCARLLDRCGEA